MPTNPFIELKNSGATLDQLNQASITPATDFQEKVGAAFDMGEFDRTSKQLERYLELNEIKNKSNDVRSAQELNELFPDVDRPFNSSMNLLAAQEIYDRNQRYRALQMRMANGPDNWYTNTAGFAAGLIPHMYDPMNIASDLVVGNILSAGARAYKYTSAFAKSSKFVPRATTALVTDTIANLAVEPVAYMATRAEQRDYTMYDSFLNSVGGALGGLVLREGVRGLKAIPRFLRKTDLENTKPDVALSTAIAQMGQGLKPNVEDIFSASRFVRVESSTLPREYNLRQISEDLDTRSLYRVSKDSVAFSSTTGAYGEGTYLIENPEVASRLKSDPYLNSNLGTVEEFRVNTKRFLDADGRLNAEQKEIIANRLGSKSKNISSLKDALEFVKSREDSGKMPEGSLEVFKQELASTGIDAIHYVDNIDGRPTNVVMALNESVLDNVNTHKLKQLGMDTDTLQENALKYAMSPTSRLDYDPELMKEFEQTRATALKADVDRMEINEKLKELQENKDIYKSSDVNEIIEAVSNLEAEETFINKAVSLAKNC